MVSNSNENGTSLDDMAAPQNAELDVTDNSTTAVNKNQDADRTRINNITRLMNNGKMRLFVFGGLMCVVFGTIIGVRSCSGDVEQQKEPGTVEIPKTNASGSATLTAEQAEIARQQQAAAADKANSSDSTYIAPIITVRDEPDALVGVPTQPGLDSRYARPVDYDVAEKPYGIGGALQQEVETATTLSTKVEPYQVTPLDNSESTLGVSDSNNTQAAYSNERTELTSAATSVDQWREEYLAKRKHRADQIEAMSQVAFESQLSGLTEAAKPATSKNLSLNASGYQTSVLSYPTNSIYDSNFGPQYGQPSIGGDASSAPSAENILIRAGTTYHARLITAVDTDAGSDIMAVIIGGKYNQAQLMGRVEKTSNNIQFRFDRLIPKVGDELSINAVAMELGTNALAMADSINHHYITRYGSLGLSSALSGYGEAYRQTSAAAVAEGTSGTTVIADTTDPTNARITGNVVGELGNQLASEISKTTNRPTTYKTESGKIFNLFFSQSVTSRKNERAQTSSQVSATQVRQ